MTRWLPHPTPALGVPALNETGLAVADLLAQLDNLRTQRDQLLSLCGEYESAHEGDMAMYKRRGAAEEREAIADMFLAEMHGLAANTFLAGMSGDQENAARGEIASTVLGQVVDLVRARSGR